MKLDEVVKSTCPYCGVGCGVLIGRNESGEITVKGDPDHPANLGKLCSKGAALGETVALDGRLLSPEIDGERASWDQALDRIADTFSRIIREHGPDAVAFYVSGQLLTEDYYVANKLMKGFIGSGNIDTNSRLCMASAVAGHRRAFGADTVPCRYQDLEQADLVTLVGSNTAWCHPVLFQRIRKAKQARPQMRVVVIDPRRTPTCDIADLHLPIASGTDSLLFNGVLNYLRREDALDWDFLENHTEGFAEAIKAAKGSAESIPEVAQRCGVDPEAIGQFFRWFSKTEKAVTLFSQGINQSSSGTDKVNAIINCHLASGRIGRPGMGPFSITGQPNAMGGREVGGLANTLAAHMPIDEESAARVGRFWGSAQVTRTPGLKAVDLFRALGEGRVKAIWIMGTNPMVSLPDADTMGNALARAELVVVSDCEALTPTTRMAHIRLPAAAWGEKEGTVTNSERCISRQRPFLPLPGEARPDWWIVTQVARRMGFTDAFPYHSTDEIFREHARLSGFENEQGGRSFDCSGLAELDQLAYQQLSPTYWPVRAHSSSAPSAEPFADRHFFHPSGRARFIAVDPTPPQFLPTEDFPLILNTGRVRDHWHTLTRTGRSPRLSAHRPEPLLSIHPDDASAYALIDGGLARLFSRWGEVILRVELDQDQRPGALFVPIHWNGQFAGRATIGAVVNPVVDPVSGEPEFKHTPVRVEPFSGTWYGFLLSRNGPDLGDTSYWVKSRGRACWRFELAGDQNGFDPMSWARTAIGDGEWVEMADAGAGRYRGARFVNGALDACLFVARSPQLPPRGWLMELFERDALSDIERASLLSGRPPKGESEQGAIVCSCFGVGRNRIIDAIKSEGLTSAEAIGAQLEAGTNCGSCVPELRTLIEQSKSL